MTESFLHAYPKLDGQSQYNVSGLWLAHGDEPLLTQWLLDAIRQHWQQQNFSIVRLELTSAKAWQDVLGELSSLSLFDDATAVIVTGNHKPDQSVTAELENFAQEVQSGSNTNSLLWLTSKLDKRAQRAKWFAPFGSLGTVIDCNLYQEQQRQQILQLKAAQFGLQLNQEAWQLLMSHTQHHLLSAYQTLWRLSYLFTPQIMAADTKSIALGADDLQAALVSNAQFSVFDLSDAMLSGHSIQVVKIINQLKITDEPPPLVLWTIGKDMRLVAQLMAGQDPASLGIWRSKQSLYQAACRRHSLNQTSQWPDLLYRCDQAIKGIIRQPAWELLLQAALSLAATPLFTSNI